MEQTRTATDLEPGSFRDPDSRVVRSEGRIFRVLSKRGLADWRAFSASPLFAELIDEGKLIGTREADGVDLGPSTLHGPVAGRRSAARVESRRKRRAQFTKRGIGGFAALLERPENRRG